MLRLLMTLALAAGGDSSSASPAGPNILWLSVEDICPHLGCYGDRNAITPTLDRLATQSVRYTAAFGITGVCAPNRSCLITGVYPSSLGSQDMRSTTVLPPEVKCFSQYLREAGYYCTNNAKTDYNFAVPKEAWDESSRKAHWRNRRPGQPFFAVFNDEVTHESQARVPEAVYQKNTARLTPAQRHDPAQMVLPPYHPDTPESRRDWARYYDNITAMDYHIADKLAELEQAGLADETIVFFFGDNGTGLPGMKKWIWEGGLHVPLLIRFPQKYQHLAPAAAGATTDRLVSFVDFAPTVLSLAGVPLPQHFQGSAFLGPAAGAPRQYVYALRDRMAERFDTVRAVRDARYQYLRNFQPHLSWSQFTSYTEEMPLMKRWRELAEQGQLSGPPARYFEPTKPVEELYDNQADPHQVQNLAGDPAYRETLKRLRGECLRWMHQTHDLGLLPEFEREQRSMGRTPWDAARDAKANPLDRLLEVAELANSRQAGNVDRLGVLLKDPDTAVRWWSATGLLALGASAASQRNALTVALNDGAPEIRVAAAEALCLLGSCDQGLPVLRAALKHDSAVVRLRALNALDRLGPAARPAIPDIRRAGVKEKSHVGDYVNRMVEYLPERLER